MVPLLPLAVLTGFEVTAGGVRIGTSWSYRNGNESMADLKKPQAVAAPEDAVQDPDQALWDLLDLALGPGSSAGKDRDSVARCMALHRAYLDALKFDFDHISEGLSEEESMRQALGLLNTKYALERNLLAEERSLLAEHRTRLGERRTKASVERTELAENRSGLARIRTLLARNRSFLAEKRTIMAQQRTFLAKARTELAFMRTGVALIALATALMRYFGVGWWTLADGTIFLLGVLMVGTGIYYYLPTRRQEGKLLDLLRQKEMDLMSRKPRIMVLDDDPAVCESLKVYLSKAGYDVEPFVDPVAAKERLEIREFDVVITDLMMERIDGLEMLHIIKRISPSTQVILLSYTRTPQYLLQGMRDDLFDYFVKPVNIKDLEESVQRAVQKKKLNPP